jgi:hypothetical protein
MVSRHPSYAGIDRCLGEIDQLFRLRTPGDRHVRDDREDTSIIDAVCGDPSFQQLVHTLRKFSEASGLDGYRHDEDTGFAQSVTPLTHLSSHLDLKWTTRDISRAFSSPHSWRLRLLDRLEAKLDRHGARSCSLNTESHFSVERFLLTVDSTSERAIYDNQSGISLLHRFKRDVANTYEWGGNEMTMKAAMALIFPYFTSSCNNTDSPLAILVLQIYRWIVKVTVNRELSSAAARIAAGRFLDHVAKFEVNYGEDPKMEWRPGYLRINLLQDINVRVKYRLARTIGCGFTSFPSRDRVHAYQQILDCLEVSEANSEGFALRAYTLMQLALTSDDIRRPAMVNLLELGKFEACLSRVSSCFAYIAKCLYADDPRLLFSQNSSQFIHSWIDFDEDIFQFPFSVFGFLDFDEWSLSVRSELISQLINKDRWSDAAQLFRWKTRFEVVLAECLPQIISDHHLTTLISIDRANDVPARCIAALGRDMFQDILISHFALSLAKMVERLDDSTLSSHSFEILDACEASAVLSAMHLPDLSPNYPNSPQPSFSLQSVMIAIDAHASSLDILSKETWSSPNVVYILRRLINRGASGSDRFVTLSFLRRIVFVVCMAPDVAATGYLHEMLIMGLIEFLRNPSVFREAMQVLKWLVSVGKIYITSHLSYFRTIIAKLLPAIDEIASSGVESELEAYIRDCYRWLERLIGTLRNDREEIQSISHLLCLMNDRRTEGSVSAGEVIENLVRQDRLLWRDIRTLKFTLRVLSRESDVYTEKENTLEALVTHFLSSQEKSTYTAKSKAWLGLALGRISEDVSQVGLQRQEDGDIPRSDSFSTPSHHGRDKGHLSNMVTEVIYFMKSEFQLAEMLEHALRHMNAGLERHHLIEPVAFADVMKSLVSRHTVARPIACSQPLPVLSDVERWVHLDGLPFDRWHTDFACAIAQALDNTLFLPLVPVIQFSPKFRDRIFPYLVDEYQSQPPSEGMNRLSEIFNTILHQSSTHPNLDIDYFRFIIRIVLFLREQSSKLRKSKSHGLLDREINYLAAANAAVSCRMYNAAFMFLELSGKQGSGDAQFVERLLATIYRNIEDPDLAQVLTHDINRAWHELVDVYNLNQDREGINSLRRARLRGKVELDVKLSPTDDDLSTVGDLIRQDGFPLSSIEMTTTAPDIPSVVGMYGSAWRLGKWELPPARQSTDPDALIYSVLLQLQYSTESSAFLSILDSAVIQCVDQVLVEQSSKVPARLRLVLSMFSSLKELCSGGPSIVSAARSWGDRLQEMAKYGR